MIVDLLVMFLVEFLHGVGMVSFLVGHLLIKLLVHLSLLKLVLGIQILDLFHVSGLKKFNLFVAFTIEACL